MIGRRGAIQSAFSIGELREMATSVEDVQVSMEKEEFAASENPSSLAELEASRPKKRKHELMKQIHAGTVKPLVPHSQSGPMPKQLHIRYLLSPKEFLPHKIHKDRVGAIVLER